MAGDVAVAGTYVAAVLEQAGYLTQGEFIVAFKSFFRDAGALVYFIGAVGGLLSLVLFGSFRAPRYLIIGPALFWFLVGPTKDVGGVVAKLGGGEARGFIGVKGEAGAQENVEEVLKKSGRDAPKDIKVAEGFWLFAYPINEFVNEFVDVMLKHEDGADLMVEQKVRGLELIARTLPTSPKEINILEQELLVQCPRLYQSALGIAQNYIKARAVEGISSNSVSAGTKYTTTANQQWDNYLKAGEMEYMTLTSDAKGTPKLYEFLMEQKGKTPATSKAWAGEVPKTPISCGEAWDVFLEMIWDQAAKRIPNLLRLSVGAWTEPEGFDTACKLLTSKLYDDAPVDGNGGGVCDLQPGVAMALLANHLAYMDTFQSALKRHENSQDPMNPKAHSSIVASTTLMAQESQDIQNALLASNQLGMGISVGMMPSVATAVSQVGMGVAVIDYAPAITMNLMQGITNTEQVGLPIYIMTSARRELYAKAMNMPYYQGICLYLIAVSYPFLALLVLLPGKAQVFLNVPLAWLWIKSWDIGFAAVILLERVMYNLLPNFSLSEELRTKEAWDWTKLPIVLGEGFNFNHVQNVAHYYTILAMATAGIPIITGVIVLKAKKAILGSFVGAIESNSKAAAMREAGEYSITASNERSDLRARIEGAAKQLPHMGAGGVDAGLRHGKGFFYGAIRTMATSPEYLAGKGAASLVKKGTDSAGKFMSVYTNMVGSELKYESGQRGAFDQMFGRWGMLQMSADSYAAALDGAGTRLSGGFETNAPKGNNMKDHIDMVTNTMFAVVSADIARGELIGKTMGEAVSDPSAAKALLGGYFLKEGIGLLQDGSVSKDLKEAMAAGEGRYEEMMAKVSERLSEDNREPGTFNYFSVASNLINQGGFNGYESAVQHQRNLGLSAETILEMRNELFHADGTEEEKNNAKARIDALMSQKGVVGDYFQFMFADSTAKELATIPGGASEQPTYGFGGNRAVYQINVDENGQMQRGDLIGGSEYQKGGFFSEKQASIASFAPLAQLGIVWDQEAVFMNQRQSSDLAILESRPLEYKNNFFQIANFLSESNVFQPVQLDAGASNLDQMRANVSAMIDSAQAKSDMLSGDGNRFKLPGTISEIGHANPLFAAQIVANFYETYNQAEKAENNAKDFFNATEKQAMPFYSTPGQATRGTREGKVHDKALKRQLEND